MKLFPSIQNVLRFLESKGLNIKVSFRYSSDSWCYDGDSIALMKHGKIEKEGEIYDEVNYTEHDILHEIAHWIVASNEQRLFPEYGLALGIVDQYALGTYKDGIRDQNGILTSEAYSSDIFDGFLDKEEQELQEFVTQKITIFLGRLFNVESNLSDWKGTWDQYEDFKQDSLNKESIEFIEKVNLRFLSVCKTLL